MKRLVTENFLSLAALEPSSPCSLPEEGAVGGRRGFGGYGQPKVLQKGIFGGLDAI